MTVPLTRFNDRRFCTNLDASSGSAATEIAHDRPNTAEIFMLACDDLAKAFL